ncbi:S-adenosyl-L-methionine-dependent methyltransferase [Dactylonectria macrodidyma]|uniref:S-adenosyl-L-methionine-dependent methyltransferase n=1 Tax=Dactylonectria macrodidyma TaxID=307937 RepID=A0A9P9JJI3_9HYPO|nr:S-adenosyl-L-methionine-dependent methyltransferase [Dactylonectria macrodidyma]
MDDNNNPEDDTGMSDTCSNFSTVSEDSLPPIHAYSHTYHGSGQLMTPNDESEARRMALQHKLFSLCLDGGLIDAKLPLENHTPENPLQILDIGSGSGIWACEMGQLHPQVNILGIDITRALLPTNVPTNVTFEIADVMDPWPPQTYDFIHMRNLVGGGIRDWQGLIDRAFAHLKPGGMLEFTENRPRFFDVDPEHADLPGLPAGARPDVGAACREFQAAFGAMCEKQGLNSDPIPDVPGFLSELGAESIRERSDWLPVKVWGNDPIMRKKGEILGEMLNYSFENASLMLFGKCGWEEKDTRALLDRVLKEVQDPNLRSTVQVTFITARKPLVPSKPEADGPETTDTNTEQVD